MWQVSAVGTVRQALAWETFATFQLALVAFAAVDRAAPQGGLALGSAVAAGTLAAVRTPTCLPPCWGCWPPPWPALTPLSRRGRSQGAA